MKGILLAALIMLAASAVYAAGPFKSVTVYHGQTVVAASDTSTLLTAGQVGKVVPCKGFSAIQFVVQITGINTNMTARYEGKINPFDWFALDATNDTTAYTANGTYGKLYPYAFALDSARVKLQSIGGGTAGRMNTKIELGSSSNAFSW
jgi:hypothetical protein